MRLFVFLILFALNAFFVYSQNDSIFPNQYAKWTIQKTTIDPSLNYIREYFDIQLYPNSGTDTFNIVYQNNTIAYLYYDSLRVFIKRGPTYYWDFRPDFGSNYELLYDFGLMVGDTAYFDHGMHAIVQNIDSVIIQGVPRRRIIFSNNDEWLMGVGSNQHPLRTKVSLFEGFFLLCEGYFEYSGNSNIDTMSIKQNNCFYDVGINNLFIDSENTFYPNPSSDFVYIENIDHKNINSIDIYSMLGKLLMSYSSDEFHTNNKIQLNLRDLPEGFIIICIRYNNGINKKYKLMKK